VNSADFSAFFAQARGFSPWREVFRLGEKVFSPKRGYSRQGEKSPGASVLSGVSSPRREILRSDEHIFTLRREYFCLGENWQCSLDYFCSSEIIFGQASGIFARAKFVLPRLKKK